MGRRIKPGVSLDADFEEGYAALGYAMSVTKEINTDMYLSSVIDLTHTILDREFTTFVNALALNNPENFRHVYEPGMIGISEAALWYTTLYGRGRTKEVSFEWKPSIVPILSPEERKSDSQLGATDAMRHVPDEIIEKLSDRNYVFKMVAPIMEYGLRVNIQPVYSKFLFIPTEEVNYHRVGRRGGKAGRKTSEYGARQYRFEKYNVPDWGYRNPQEPSGAGDTVGQFTTAWVVFWNGGEADTIWATEIAPRIEMGLSAIDTEIDKAAKMKRKRKTSVTLSTFNDNKAAFESGANLARAFIRGKARSYRQAAKHVDKHGYFGGEREF